jgi:hypothetical protein
MARKQQFGDPGKRKNKIIEEKNWHRLNEIKREYVVDEKGEIEFKGKR